MPIPGVMVEEICDAILSGYDANELAMMVRTKLGVTLNVIVGQGPLGTMVFDLVEWSEKRGKTAELIRAAYKGNPTNPDIQALFLKYGLATPVDLQTAGNKA